MGSVELGQTIRRARVAGELSYGDVREATGLAKSHLQRLERGEVAKPSPDVLRRLAQGLGVDYSTLMRAAGYL